MTTNKPETYTVRGIEVSEPILFSSALSKIIQYLDNPENRPINSHNGIEVYFRVGNVFIFSFDTEEKREEYKKAYEELSSGTSWSFPRIGNFFEKDGKYYFVGDYSDAKLPDISDTTKTNWVLYRGVVINPVIYREQQQVKDLVQDSL